MRLIAAALVLGTIAAAPAGAADPPAAPEQQLTLRGWLGGTEPGTSKNAFEAQAAYRYGDLAEAVAGGSWTDNIFYTAYKGFAEASWFYAEYSYLRGAFTYRSYDYTGASRPTPDSNAYASVPRPEVEISHSIAGRVRLTANYQLFLPNFFYDSAKRIVNHKVSGEVEVKVAGGFSASVMAALLRDPSPGRTRISGRRLPAGMVPDLLSGQPDYVCVPADPALGVPVDVYCAARTSVVQRTELLLGGGLAYDAERWNASVRYIPNRDLDSGFSWSLVSKVGLRPIDKLGLDLMWIQDNYADAAGPLFKGKSGYILWGVGRYALTPELTAGAGVKWVRNPGPRGTGGDLPRRDDATLLLQVEYRIVL